jgi:hypothetical protein
VLRKVTTLIVVERSDFDTDELTHPAVKYLGFVRPYPKPYCASCRYVEHVHLRLPDEDTKSFVWWCPDQVLQAVFGWMS